MPTVFGITIGAETQRKRTPLKMLARYKVPLADQLTIASQLVMFSKAGLTFIDTFEILEQQIKNPKVKDVIFYITEDVKSGVSLSGAFHNFGYNFEEFLIAMIDAGEASGEIEKTLTEAVTFLADSQNIKKKVKGAMAYPVVMLSITVIAVIVMLIFVIPTFTESFASAGNALPGPTQLLVDMSEALKKYYKEMIAVIVGVVTFFKLFGKKPWLRPHIHNFFDNAPVAKVLRRKIAIARFCRVYSTLNGAGVIIHEVIEMCRRASDNYKIEQLCDAIKLEIEAGNPVSTPFYENKYVPVDLTYMIKSGEKTGQIDEMLSNAANMYEEDVRSTVATISSLMEPILILVVGSILGSIVIALFLPMFSMFENIK